MTDNGRPGPRLLAETAVTMLAASIAIRCLSFERLCGLMSRSPRTRSPADPAVIGIIRRSVEAWARRLPWRTLCFEQGLTAHWLLQRRSHASSLSYGAAQRDGTLLTHVWVHSGSHAVIGCENADEYIVLSHFTNASSSSSVHA